MQDRLDAGQDGYSTRRMQDRTDAAGRILDMSDSGQVGCSTGRLLDSMDAKQNRTNARQDRCRRLRRVQYGFRTGQIPVRDVNDNTSSSIIKL